VAEDDLAGKNAKFTSPAEMVEHALAADTVLAT
jgi:hypothetical protein